MDEKLFLSTRALKRGEASLDPSLLAFCDRLNDSLGVRPLNVVFDAIDIGPNSKRPRLKLIFEMEDDLSRIHKDWLTILPQAKKTILRCWKQSPAIYSGENENIHLVTDCFSTAAVSLAAEKMRRDHEVQLLQVFAHEGVWSVAGVGWLTVVFFTTEDIKTKALASGVAATIESTCYKAIKEYDEFGYVSRDTVKFDFASKEVLDRDYEGSIFYYFK